MPRRRLRIAQVAPLSVSVPPPAYGGTERVVHALTEELVARGHDVTLFAAGGSRSAARLVPGSPRPLWEMEPTDTTSFRILQVQEVVRMSGGFDVVHSHIDFLPWVAGNTLRAPLLTTLHGRLDLPGYGELFAANSSQPLVSISAAQRRPLAQLNLNWMATIYHGLPDAYNYALGAGSGGYLLFVGRLSPEKGAHMAIRAAIAAGMPIRLAAPLHEADRAYFDRQIAPHLGHPLVDWMGEVGESCKIELLRGAVALVAPIEWDEPFGLVFIEALACGTPVITRAWGATPEIIRDGEHGFFAESLEEIVVACQSVRGLDRSGCRARVLQHFTVERMVDAYEGVYHALAEPARPGGRGTGIRHDQEELATLRRSQPSRPRSGRSGSGQSGVAPHAR